MQVPGEQHPARAPDGTHMLPHNVRVNPLPTNMLPVVMTEEVTHLLMSLLNAVAPLKAGIFFGSPMYADKNTLSLDNLWENLKSEGTTLIDKSVEFTTDLSKKINYPQ